MFFVMIFFIILMTHNNIVIIILLCVITFFILITGISSMAINSKFYKKNSNFLMSLRVIMQAVTIVCIIILMLKS